VINLEPGAALFHNGDPADSVYVVVQGTLELSAVKRGDAEASELRQVRAGGTLGEEALVAGLKRAGVARAVNSASVAEAPAALLRRALERAGDASALAREVRTLRRDVARDLLLTSSPSRFLDATELELLLDSVRYASYDSGQWVQRQGELAVHCSFLQKGLLQIQSEHDARVRVHGYLSPGDFFGDEELLSGSAYTYSTVALGDSVCLHAGADVMRNLCDRNPRLVQKLRRMSITRKTATLAPGAQLAGMTQHVLKDAYRMQMARSLLAIDQNSCVRCGHCAWACAEVHEGVTRLIRSGDKILVPTNLGESEGLASLLLPNTCQHCEHPACTIDCPTGAIGRDLEGEVFVREDSCTGCGACAKACPWQNIQMAPRLAPPKSKGKPGSDGPLSQLVAVKCDLCRDYEAPACVRACPTDAVQRLDPNEQFDAVRALFGPAVSQGGPSAPERRSAAVWGFRIASALLLVVFFLLVPRVQDLGKSAILSTGGLALLGTLVLAGHALPKRGVRFWMRRREQRGLRSRPLARAGSLLSPWVKVHQTVGLVTLGAVIAHSGFSVASGLSGLLMATFLLSAGSGIFGAVVYRVVPRRVTALEWRGALPEELPAERELLLDRLYESLSGADVLLKKVAERVLVPYSESPWEGVRLLFSGRDLRAERARLIADINARLEGRGGERLAGLQDLVRTVVDLRALPIRRFLTAMLRWWQPLHAILTVTLLLLLALHVWAQVGG
jgi:Fe-S-cluster-containing dehydrogenase component